MEDSRCGDRHASNAILQAAKNGVRIDGAELYTTASPCWSCFKLIANAGIRTIYYGEFYREQRIHDYAEKASIASSTSAGSAAHFVASGRGRGHLLACRRSFPLGRWTIRTTFSPAPRGARTCSRKLRISLSQTGRGVPGLRPAFSAGEPAVTPEKRTPASAEKSGMPPTRAEAAARGGASSFTGVKAIRSGAFRILSVTGTRKSSIRGDPSRVDLFGVSDGLW
jgi:hypothetical protein